ncbi:hypothetical protein KDW54_06850 [Burkholderia ambifaria]|uniref:hypothetical protein n=1 Tax=Burkholderia ambifaria TaxID=152480 RepID=UPI001BA239CB|nr:hypothetical protein [Burkholderia ambifaria]MBR8182114.1 hypothetical protein [Burkholderia ambifaria]
MSDVIEQAGVVSEFPKSGQSGNGRTTGYSVEARFVTTSQDHVVINGVIYTDRWKRVHVDQGPVGVPPHGRFESWLDQCLLMNYPAAQAIRWWFHALAEADFHNICLETRIVKHEVEYSYKERAVSEHALVGGEDRSNIMPDWGKK